MDKPVFIMYVGLPSSGKSTHSKKLAEEINAAIFSSDNLRDEMFGDATDQKHNVEVFHELHKRIKECLKSGGNAIYDATNLSSKRRRGFLQNLKNIECEKRCIIMATPYEQCLQNNRNRDRVVPEHVIEKMYRSWHTPYWFEGWNSIEIVYWEGCKDSINPVDFILSTRDFSQDNPHHTLTLGEHLFKTAMSIDVYCSSSVIYAAAFHDNGKVKCKTYTDYKGRECEHAHFYRHENIGAYDALFLKRMCDSNVLDMSILINLHMYPYVWEKHGNEKLKNKYKKLWGESLFDDVMILHEADKTAH